MLKSRYSIGFSIGFDTRSHIEMVVGDPAIGDEGDANPTVYHLVAMNPLDHQLDTPTQCPICGCLPAEDLFVELYMTPWGFHMQLLINHRGTNGEPGGCFWSCPINSNANIARVGPLAHGDTQPSG